MIDLPRYTLSEWVNLIASPSSLRYYALFTMLCLVEFALLGAGVRPRGLGNLVCVAIFVPLGFASAIAASIALLNIRFGNIGWGNVWTVTLTAIAAVLVMWGTSAILHWLSSRKPRLREGEGLARRHPVGSIVTMVVVYLVSITGIHAFAHTLTGNPSLPLLDVSGGRSDGSRRVAHYNALLLIREESLIDDNGNVSVYNNEFDGERNLIRCEGRDDSGNLVYYGSDECADRRQLVKEACELYRSSKSQPLLAMLDDGKEVLLARYYEDEQSVCVWEGERIDDGHYMDTWKTRCTIRYTPSFELLGYTYYDSEVHEDGSVEYTAGRTYDSNQNMTWYYEDTNGDGEPNWHEATTDATSRG